MTCVCYTFYFSDSNPTSDIEFTLALVFNVLLFLFTHFRCVCVCFCHPVYPRDLGMATAIFAFTRFRNTFCIFIILFQTFAIWFMQKKRSVSGNNKLAPRTLSVGGQIVRFTQEKTLFPWLENGLLIFRCDKWPYSWAKVSFFRLRGCISTTSSLSIFHFPPKQAAKTRKQKMRRCVYLIIGSFHHFSNNSASPGVLKTIHRRFFVRPRSIRERIQFWNFQS